MSAIANETLAFWGQFDALEPSAELGGIYAAKPGYHNYRNALAGGDYSVAEVSDDRSGPGDKAAAIDLTMNDAAMRKYTTRLDDAARHRDPRLFIDGRPVIREFIGTKDSRSVYCYVLTGGRARGLPTDASPDYGRDSSHLWHLHISVIRRFVATKRAYDGLYSILRGESLADWNARENPAQTPAEEDDMIAPQSYPIPAGYAFGPDGTTLIDKTKVLLVGAPAAGLKGHPYWAGKGVFLSVGGDFSDGGDERLRVAIHNGSGWSVSEVLAKDADGRGGGIKVPPAGTDSAYKIEVSRIAPKEGESDGSGPLFLMVEILP